MPFPVRLSFFLAFATATWSAEFRSGQAARAVLGQSSFALHENRITPTNLSIADGKLFVADSSKRVLTYELASIPDRTAGLADDGPTCSLCGFSPASVTEQSVMPGIARVSASGVSVAVTDPATHRVLLWRDTRSPTAALTPDVTLGGIKGVINASTLVDPISVALDGQRLFIGDAALHRVLLWNSLPLTDDQPADVVLGQSDFGASSDTFEDPGRITRPAALLSDGNNLFVADPVNRRVLVFSPSDLSLTASAFVNSATLTPGPLAPGTLFTLNAPNLAVTTQAALDDGDHDLPTALGGVTLVLNGRRLKLISVSPDEVCGQLPYDLSGINTGSLYARVESGEGQVSTSNPVSIEFRPTSPGILAFAGSEPRSGMLLHAEESAARRSTNPVTSAEPAKPGQVLVVLASGLGLATDIESGARPVAGRPYPGRKGQVLSPIRAEISGTPVEVLSATLPYGSIGIYEVRVLVPSDLPPDRKPKLTILQGEVASNTVTFPIAYKVQ
jgi:uncharacterized protein (TIGR03437 family)